jgi:hypothetical protein
LFPPISNTTLLLPLPNKSAVGKVIRISSGLFQSAYLITESQIRKETLLRACMAAKASKDFFFISLTCFSKSKDNKTSQKVKKKTPLR